MASSVIFTMPSDAIVTCERKYATATRFGASITIQHGSAGSSGPHDLCE